MERRLFVNVTFGCCSEYAFCAATSHFSEPGASVSPHHQTSIVTGSVGRSWASAVEEASRRVGSRGDSQGERHSASTRPKRTRISSILLDAWTRHTAALTTHNCLPTSTLASGVTP